MVDKELKRPAAGAAAPLHEVRQSIQSDLHYVSLQLDGKTYGGWYRVLPDGRMELLALANMRCELRSESTPIEQARVMLKDFVLAATSKPTASPEATGDMLGGGEAREAGSPSTLGDLLYADASRQVAPESEWVALVHAAGTHDQLALNELFERTHRLVFTLIIRLIEDVEIAEELTLDVFQDVSRHAASFDPTASTVLAWIMNLARFRALQRLELARTKNEEGLTRRAGPRPPAQHAFQWMEPEWDEVAPGIACKLLARDAQKDRISMLVRLAPGVEYPAHTHAGLEELHLLAGDLWIDERRLFPGDYNRAERGTSDRRVYSETGCTCVLITSSEDVLLNESSVRSTQSPARRP